MTDRPLRIHFVLTSLPVGGAETLLLNLVRGLDRTHFAPTVLCLKQPGQLGEDFARQAPLYSQLLRHKYDLAVLWRLYRIFRQQRADAVITVGAGDKMFWGRLAARLAGVPVICSALHSTGWPDGVGRLNRLLTPLTDGFIAVASHHAEHLVHQEQFPAERVFLIPNGVDTQRFVPDPGQRRWLRDQLRVAPETPLVGIVAALREEKNHEQFVEAAGLVWPDCPNAQFVIVGDGPQRSRIQAALESTGRADRFHLLGNRLDTHRILPGLDVFCLTSRNEANPVSILEALSCGIPVVAPNVGSIAETVQPDQTGFLTEPLCARSTASALLRLLRDPALARRLGANGRQQVASRWSLEAMVEGYQSLIEQLYHRKADRQGTARLQPTFRSGLS